MWQDPRHFLAAGARILHGWGRAELLAVEDLFVDLGVTPSISTVAGLQHFKAPNIDIFAGNIFDLQRR